MSALVTPRDAAMEGPPVTVCPECGVAYWDPSVLHCEHDGAYLEPAGDHKTRIDRIVGGRYQLLGKIGQGGMGTVYLAEHGLSKRRVALKIIRPELESSPTARNRFLRECESLERIKSPHVVEVLESGAAPGGEIYLVMERLEGVPLGARTDEGALPIAEVASIGAQVAAALTAAHAAGIVHRDLKPDNVFLCDSGVVKVLDFGIARLLDGRTLEGASNKLTATGTIVGTPAYMSPEGAAGAAVGPAADLYSFGVMLYEMVSGELPFWAEQPVLVLGKHLKEKPPPLPASVPAPLARLIGALLEKDPQKRPASAAEVERVLRSLASGEVPLAPARRRRGPWIAAAALIAVAPLVGVAIALLSPPTDPASVDTIDVDTIDADTVDVDTVGAETAERPAAALAPPVVPEVTASDPVLAVPPPELPAGIETPEPAIEPAPPRRPQVRRPPRQRRPTKRSDDLVREYE